MRATFTDMSRSLVTRALLVFLRWSLGAALICVGLLMCFATAAGLVPIATGVVLIGTPCAVRIAGMDVYEPGGLTATSRTLAVVVLPALAMLTAVLLLLATGR